jgi:hypothetical protein
MHEACLLSVALTEMNIGNVLSAQGDYENALLHLKKAQAIQEVALGPSHVNVAMILGNMALAHSALGKHGAAIQHL